jgi:glycosyltransferase involved in cell wall biosynthesis
LARLIFINRYFYPDHSATAQLLSDLAFHLADGGQEVHVVTSRQIYDDAKVQLEGLENVRDVRVHRVQTSRRGRGGLVGRAADQLSFHAAAAPLLMRLLAAGDIIIAKTDPPLVSVLAARIARLRGARLVNWLQDLYPEVMLRLGVSLPGARVLARLRDGSLRAAEANVVIGDLMAAHVQDMGAANVHVIPNWVDDEAIRPVPASENSLRRDWGLAGKFVVGYSGNLGRAHEIDTVLAAATELRDRSDIVFLFVGDGYWRPELEARVAARGLGNFVFRPYQPTEALALSLGVADVHWLSLRPELEGLIVPSKFYGIAAAGRPLIAVTSPTGEIARLVAKYQCGYVVPVGEGTRLAAFIRQLAGDETLVAKMGTLARAMLEDHFSRAQALRSWSDLLSGLRATPHGEPRHTPPRKD